VVLDVAQGDPVAVDDDDVVGLAAEPLGHVAADLAGPHDDHVHPGMMPHGCPPRRTAPSAAALIAGRS
jgi:hypothetical protein